MKDHRHFRSKILLFGEYSIILDSKALSLPFPLFQGTLRFPSTHERYQASSSHQELLLFADYLEQLQRREPVFPLDLASLRFDLSQGLFFDSSIPQGYGVGSSGALVANLFYRYQQNQDWNGPSTFFQQEDLLQLRHWLGKMECHFHGQSSGLDPLISYVNRPMLIQSESNMKLVDLPFPFWFEAGNKELQNMSIFLVNTKKTRSTGPLVQLFLEMRKEKQFVSLCDQIFLPLNEKLIEQFLSGDMISMYPSFHQLSEFQFTYFRSMIPSFVQDHWKKGLDHDLYALKLCGAGGGGFLLGITRDLEKTQQDLHPFEIRRLF